MLERQELLVGTWKLVSGDVRSEGHEPLYPWGEHPQGFLIYAADGYMSAVITTPDRPHFLADDLLKGSLEEQAQAARTYLSYSGPYDLHEDMLVHHVEVSLYPNWVGQDQIRYIDEISEERLVLRTPPMPLAGRSGVGYLIWRRA